MKLSLVTGTRNRPSEFRRLMHSIAKNTTVEHELIVADASDEPIDQIGMAPNVHVIPERPRLGMALGYNKAFAFAQGDWIIWLNDDAEVTSHYDVRCIEFMEAHPEIGLGAIPYSENGAQTKINQFWGMDYANFGIIRRSFGDEIGWFDPEIPMYGSDNALAFRVLLAGKGIARINRAKILHWAEHDAERIKNNVMADRLRDVEILRAKYLPYLPQMLQTYEQHRIPVAV